MIALSYKITVMRIKFQYVTNAGLEMTLEALSKTEYSWEELQQRPLPDGVDPAKLEKYLSGTDFKVNVRYLNCSDSLKHGFLLL